MGEWSWEAAFHGSVHTATLAVATVLALFVLVLGSFGNGLVLLSAVRRRKVRRNFDLLILNLSTADLLLSVLLAPLYLYTLFSDPPAPQLFCGSLLFGATGCGLLSLLSIVAVAIHRQARVVGRAKRSLTSRQTGVVLAAVWTLSAAGAVGATLHAMLDWRDSYSNCQVLIYSGDPLLHRFTLFFLGPLVLLSFIIIIISYAVIARAVRAQSRARTQGLAALYRAVPLYKQTDPLVPDKASPGDSDKKSSWSSLRQCHCCSCQAAAERENKAVTMCLVVILTLVLCWSPLLVSQFIELATGPSIILLQVKLCGIALVFLNSALDPYMYAQNNQGHVKTGYGRLFWDVLRCQCNSPRRSRFRALRTRPLGPPRSSVLEVDTPSLAPPEKRLRDKEGEVDGVVVGCEGTEKGGLPSTVTSPGVNSKERMIKTQTKTDASFPAGALDTMGAWKTVLNQTPCTVTTTTTTTNSVVSHCSRHACRTKDVMRDVKMLVHKSCCHVQVTSDQSLVES